MTADELSDMLSTTLSETVGPIRTSVLLLGDRSRHYSEVQGQTLERLRDLEGVVSSLRERLAAVESRAPVPGPPGKDGADGHDGFDLEDFSVDFDGDRTILLAFARPGRTPKRFPLTLPMQKYQGVYAAGRTYVMGDTVTSAGSVWHCHAGSTISKPGDGPDWQLAVKRGSDGRDAKPREAVRG